MTMKNSTSLLLSRSTIMITTTSTMKSIMILLLLWCTVVIVYFEHDDDVNNKAQRPTQTVERLEEVVARQKEQQRHQQVQKQHKQQSSRQLDVIKRNNNEDVVLEAQEQQHSQIKQDDIKKQQEGNGRKKIIMMNNNNNQLNGTDHSRWIIPIQFRTDKEYYHIGASFPRWRFFSSSDGDRSIPLQKSISIIDSLIHHIDKYSRYVSQYDYNIKYTNATQYRINNKIMENDPNVIHTTDHNQDWIPNYLQPEILYVVDGKLGRIMTSQYALDVADVNHMMSYIRYTDLHQLINTALQLLIKNHYNYNTYEMHKNIYIPSIQWPRLYQLLVVEKGSFPYLVHYSDYIGCNYHNYNNDTESIPLFTLAANVKCNYTFPFPTHTLYQNSKNNSNEWYDQMNEWKKKYPTFHNKISKIVFRGQLSGYMPQNETERGPRWHLAKFVHGLKQPEQYKLFDIKLINEYLPLNEYINPEEIGGFNNSYKMDFNNFQNYKAILDVDGYSWSARFSTNLLCYNSIILKIEPNYIEYYYNPVIVHHSMNNDTNNNNQHDVIMPWKHYIPIKGDLSDLVEKAEYAVDPANEEHIVSIIKNANQWCATKNIISKLNKDVLDIWEKYVMTLDESTELKNLYIQSSSLSNHKDTDHSDERLLVLKDENWEDKWNQIKDKVYNGTLQMVPAV